MGSLAWPRRAVPRGSTLSPRPKQCRGSGVGAMPEQEMRSQRWPQLSPEPCHRFSPQKRVPVSLSCFPRSKPAESCVCPSSSCPVGAGSRQLSPEDPWLWPWHAAPLCPFSRGSVLPRCLSHPAANSAPFQAARASAEAGGRDLPSLN